jgi:predicted nucleotidyltransferase
MAGLAEASLNELERRVLERSVARLRSAYGNRLRSVWLFGSRARGEPPRPESDVDVLVVVEQANLDDSLHASRLVYDVARAEGADPVTFAVKVYSPDRIAQRREIRSFFIQEVDRDKVVLAGEP